MCSQAQTYDLGADWSDTNNPNGAWTYREDSVALPHVTNWGNEFGTLFTTPQDAWAPSNAAGNFLPGWIKYNGSANQPLDWQAGDIVTHSNDGFNGNNAGVGNVLWTSAVHGTIDITGDIWNVRNIGRSNDYSLLLNGVELAHGTVKSGDGHDRAHALQFSSGIIAGQSLTDLGVNVGDTVELAVFRTFAGDAGDLSGVNLTINATATAVPEPASLSILGMGAVALLKRRRSK